MWMTAVHPVHLAKLRLQLAQGILCGLRRTLLDNEALDPRLLIFDALLDGSHQLVQGGDMSFGFSHDVVQPRRTVKAAHV
jgi:hypothetical protein